MSAKPVEPSDESSRFTPEQEELARAIAGRVGKRFGHNVALAALISLAYAFDFDEAALDVHVEELHREAKDTAGPKPGYSSGWPAWDEKVRKAHEEILARMAEEFRREHDARVAAAAAEREAERLDEQADKQNEEHAAPPKAPPAEPSGQDKPKRAKPPKKNPPDEPSVSDAEPAQPSGEPEAAAE